MLNHLNGWQRIGVVLTGLWLIFVLFRGGVGYANLATGHGPFLQTVEGQAAHCTSYAPVPAKSAGKKTFTLEEMHGCAPGALVDGTPDSYLFRWDAFLAALLFPVVIAWVFVYLLIAIVRWVARGFRKAA